MSLAEMKERIVELQPEERLEIAALIAHLNRCDDPEFQAELDERMSRMDEGHKVSAQELERIHEELIRQGR